MRKSLFISLLAASSFIAIDAQAATPTGYVGAGLTVTKLQAKADNHFDDTPAGGKIYGGVLFDTGDKEGFGLELQYSDSGEGDDRGREAKIRGYTAYGVWVFRPWTHWDNAFKFGWTWQDAKTNAGLISDGRDNNLALSYDIRRWFGDHWAVGAGVEWYNTDFSGTLDDPWRGQLLLEFRF